LATAQTTEAMANGSVRGTAAITEPTLPGWWAGGGGGGG
jgi:hypothetical protein